MAFPGMRVGLLIDGAWTDITGDVYTRDPVTITRGRTSGTGVQADPGRCTLTLDNRAGRYSPQNARSPLYGKLGRNTRLRVTVPSSEGTRMRLTGGYAATPAHASLAITGDIDIRVDAALDAWAAPDGMTYVLAGRADGAAQVLSWDLLVLDDGALAMDWTTGAGAAGYADSGVPLPVADGQRLAVRATIDIDNGSGGHTVSFYWAPTLAGPWTALGTPTVLPGTITLAAAPAAPVEVGRVSAATNFRFRPATGRVFGFQLRSGIGGTLVADPDFTAQTPGVTGFTDAAGRPWTLRDDAEITDQNTRFVGEVASWPVRWDPSGQDVHVPIEAAGILRRLGQGAKALDSTLTRRIPRLRPPPAAYWPMEDQESATQAASPIPGVAAMTAQGLEWARMDTLPSSAPLPTITPGATFYGPVPTPSGTVSVWQLQMVYRVDTSPPALETLIRVVAETGTVAEWTLQQGGIGSRVIGKSATGATVVDETIGTGADLVGQWIRLGLTVRQSGGTVDWDITWTDVGGDAGFFADSYAGTIGWPTAVASPSAGYAADLEGLSLGHISVWPTGRTTLYDGAIDSWAGDTAAFRIVRLSTEEGALATYVREAGEGSERLGPQGRATLLDLLGESAAADGGLLYEHRDSLGIAYRSRSSLYNQAPALELRYGVQREVAPPLEPVDDDQATRNDVTVTRTGGSSARVVRQDGPLSVLPPPAGVGLYDEAVTLNVAADGQAEPIAAWRVHLGTWDSARYPVVHVRLHSAPHLADAAQSVDTGSRITISNPPPWLPPGTIDLIAQGYTEILGPTYWDISFNCTPGGPWLPAVADDPVYGHADTDGSVLAAGVDAAATDLLVATTTGLPWVTARPPLNTNPSFEQDLAGWTGNGAALTRVATTSPAPGAWVMRITPDGVAVFPRAENDVVLVTAGASYTVSGWMRCAESEYTELNVNWFDAGGVYVDTSAVGHTAVAGEWAWVQGTVTAPVGAARASATPTVPGTPPSTRVLDVDQVTIRRSAPDAMPSEFPFAVVVGGEAMTVDGVTAFADDFARTVAAGGWGSASSGQAWSVLGGSASAFSVAPSTGSVAVAALSTRHIATLADTVCPDTEAEVTLLAPAATVTGDGVTAGIALRVQAEGTHYHARLQWQPGGDVLLCLSRTIAGSRTNFAVVTIGTYTASQTWRIRARLQGDTFQARAWPTSGRDPGAWQAEATDTQITTAGPLGLLGYLQPGNTNALPVTVRYRDLLVHTPQTMTVVRSVNGIVKEHASGSDVRLADMPFTAL